MYHICGPALRERAFGAALRPGDWWLAASNGSYDEERLFAVLNGVR
jgi:hypothetical protein